MRTLQVKLYDVATEYDGGYFEQTVGVVVGGWDDAILDTPLDNRVFYFMDQDEFDCLSVGDDITGDGDIVVSINRDPEITSIEVQDDMDVEHANLMNELEHNK